MKKILLVIFTLLSVWIAVGSGSISAMATGFTYGDRSIFPDLEQFKDDRYVIYKNAGMDRIELALITADDIDDRSVIAEVEGQVKVPENKEVTPGHTGSPSYGTGSGETISAIENKKLYLINTKYTCYIEKWYLEENCWIKLADTTASEIICDDYEDVLYSDFPVIEKLMKTKTALPYYRAYSGEYYIDIDTAKIGAETKYYIRFSDDGINFDKTVEVPIVNNRGIGGAFFGNDKIIVMGTPNMALSEYQRPAGFSSGCIYVFDQNCKLVDVVEATGLQSCRGFLDGYFYFASKEYTAKGQSKINYSKSADGRNYVEVTAEEYNAAANVIDQSLYKTPFETCVNIEREQNENIVYISQKNNNDMVRVIYETDDEIQSGTISLYSDLSGNVVESKWMVNLAGEDGDWITADYVYKIRLPEIDTEKTSSPITRYIWATDNYVYIDQDIEYIIRIPMVQFDNQIYVQLNDKILGFDEPPVIEDDRTLVPMRFLFEQMGADVEWNQETQTATATMNNTAVAFSINDTNAEVNGTAATMDVPARLINDKTMVPLRFLSEEMGYTVTWDEATRTAVIE